MTNLHHTLLPHTEPSKGPASHACQFAPDLQVMIMKKAFDGTSITLVGSRTHCGLQYANRLLAH